MVDTNVVVAGLLAADSASPPAIILDAMLDGSLPFLLSVELLAEYRTVLLRERIRARHGLSESEVDALLTALATHAVVVEIAARDEKAPDRGDDHLWRMLAEAPDAGLITGDALLLRRAPRGRLVIAPRDWLERRS